MKRSYDVVGYGEGISGLFACLLLASKGFSCLWVDCSRKTDGISDKRGIALPVSMAFFSEVIRQILSSVAPLLPDTLRPAPVRIVQSIIPGVRVNVREKEFPGGETSLNTLRDTYLKTLSHAMLRPSRLLRFSQRSVLSMNPWEQNLAKGLSRTGTLNYLSYLRYACACTGMGMLEYETVKEVFTSYLEEMRGEYAEAQDVELIHGEHDIAGIRIDETTIKARYYVTEADPFTSRCDGFLLYGKIHVQEHVLPVGMGDLLVISPPEELVHPLLLCVSRGSPQSVLRVSTKVPRDEGLTSLVELTSWASGMVMKRIRQIIPFLDGFMDHADFLSISKDQDIRPWFRYAEEEYPPSFFSRRRYISPIENLYLCDRMKCASLDGEGELFWGVSIANAILKDLNRSDLYGSKAR
ncbi:MAG: hypothetical protein ACP5G0_12435 [Desulfomonilia bacterium]